MKLSFLLAALGSTFACAIVSGAGPVKLKPGAIGYALPRSRIASSLLRRSAISLPSSFALSCDTCFSQLQSLFEAGLDETVQTAIKHSLSVTGFDASTQILDSTLIEYIGTNLAAPAHIGFALFNDRRLRASLLHFEFVQLGLELIHRRCLVLVLRTVILALHDDVRRQMRDAHGRLCSIDVLATGTTGPVHIDSQVRRIDVDVNVVVNFGRNEYRGK